MDTRLEKYYGLLTKDELTLILRYFEQDVPRVARKADLVRRVAEFMGGHTAEWMLRMSERDLYLLRDLVVAGPGAYIPYEMDDFPSLLERLYLVDVKGSSAEDLTLSLKEEFFFPVSEILDQVIEEKEKDGSFLADRLALGLLNIYGIMTAEEFVHTAFDLLENEPDHEELLAAVVSSDYVGFLKCVIDGETYLASPYVIDNEALLKGRKEFKKYRKLATYGIEQVEMAGAGAPYCAFGRGSDEHDTLKDVLETLGYDSLDIEDIINEIWQAAQYSTDSHYAEVMFDSVNECIEDIGAFEEYRDAVNAIAAYANSVPKWLLKGRTSNETDSLKISIKVEESPLAPPDTYGPKMPEQTNVGIDSPLNEFYKYNMAVKHVAPDDPCPCGSGLSYRRCHGKNLN